MEDRYQTTHALTDYVRLWSISSRLLLPALILVLTAPSLQAAQFKVGIGVFAFAENGADIQINYQPENSQWQYGYKYTRWTDSYYDLTKSNTMTGPLAYYLFRFESQGTFYLGVEVLRWSRSERSLFTGEVGSDSTTTPYFGVGYMAMLGNSFYYNIGRFLSPGAKLSTRTSVSSEDSSGGSDIQIQLGIAF